MRTPLWLNDLRRRSTGIACGVVAALVLGCGDDGSSDFRGTPLCLSADDYGCGRVAADAAVDASSELSSSTDASCRTPNWDFNLDPVLDAGQHELDVYNDLRNSDAGRDVVCRFAPKDTP